VIKGAGEVPLLDLANFIQYKKAACSPSLDYHSEDGQVIHNTVKCRKEISKISFPDRSLLETKKLQFEIWA
jgi:hypothetical protein